MRFFLWDSFTAEAALNRPLFMFPDLDSARFTFLTCLF